MRIQNVLTALLVVLLVVGCTTQAWAHEEDDVPLISRTEALKPLTSTLATTMASAAHESSVGTFYDAKEGKWLVGATVEFATFKEGLLSFDLVGMSHQGSAAFGAGLSTSLGRVFEQIGFDVELTDAIVVGGFGAYDTVAGSEIYGGYIMAQIEILF